MNKIYFSKTTHTAYSQGKLVTIKDVMYTTDNSGSNPERNHENKVNNEKFVGKLVFGLVTSLSWQDRFRLKNIDAVEIIKITDCVNNIRTLNNST